MELSARINALTTHQATRFVLAGVADKYKRCAERGVPTATHFLNTAEQAMAKALVDGLGGTSYTFFGGHIDSERRIMVFYPDYMDKDQARDDALVAVRCTRAKRDTLEHRDYLGALMGLGLERHMIGDIFVHETGADIVILPNIYQFLLAEYQKAGRKTIEVSPISLENIETGRVDIKESRQSLSSLRLDCVLSAIWNVSRTTAQDSVTHGAVLINGIECKKPDRGVNIADKVTYRGHGKTQLLEVVGTSKKGKIIGVFKLW